MTTSHDPKHIEASEYIEGLKSNFFWCLIHSIKFIIILRNQTRGWLSEKMYDLSGYAKYLGFYANLRLLFILLSEIFNYLEYLLLFIK